MASSTNNEKLTNGQSPEPSQQHGPSNSDAHLSEKPKQPDPAKTDSNKDPKQPAGGFDSTPVPKQPPGYTVKLTFHRATNLPMADLNSLSSDPYILAQLDTDLPTRHKEDPHLRLRTPTIRKATDPEWNCEWIVAHVPASGFKLKARIYDEDPADHDDRLGNVHVHVDRISPDWEGIKEGRYKLKKRMASKRAYLIQLVAACTRATKHLNAFLVVSVEVLGRSDGDGGRCYTVGPCWWTRHYSPILGRIANRKEPDEDGRGNEERGPKTERYKYVFDAKLNRRRLSFNHMQLPSKPVPARRPRAHRPVPPLR